MVAPTSETPWTPALHTALFCNPTVLPRHFATLALGFRTELCPFVLNTVQWRCMRVTALGALGTTVGLSTFRLEPVAEAEVEVATKVIKSSEDRRIAR